jgi:hypothetical protein
LTYLIPSDFTKVIQPENLAQVAGPSPSALAASEVSAVAEAKSCLVQRFYLVDEFAPTLPWNPASVYNANIRVVIDYPPYNAVATYNTGDCVIYNGSGCVCTTAIPTAVAFNAAHWAPLGPQCAIYFAALPCPQFEYTRLYNTGDVVFYKNKTYTCLIASRLFDGDSILQFGNIQNIPFANVFPNDPNNGPAYWGTGTPYSVPASTLPTNTTYWALGDNRDPQLVTAVADIALYHLHSRIAPRNIPELRAKRCDDARKWLTACATGAVTPSLPVLQPAQGMRIRYGGQIKNSNMYAP